MDGPAPVVWRLLLDGSAAGAWNMAVDEAVLEHYVASRVPLPPTLRLYGWAPQALSLGKAQAVPGGANLAYLRGAGIDLVRRPTGGRAVLHACERTYAVCGMADAPPFHTGLLETYLQIAHALRQGLAALGVEAVMARARPRAGRERRGPVAACFGLISAHEITVAGRKLVGSAQLRRRAAFLQHGSILIRADDRVARALDAELAPARVTDLTACLGRAPSTEELDRALTGGFAAHFEVELRTGRLAPGERARAARLYSWKYLSAAWTLSGKHGTRERRWGECGPSAADPGKHSWPASSPPR